MDGYAFSLQDAVAAKFSLPIAQRITAGAEAPPLVSGTASRIFTGAEIPLGADTVAIQELCEEKLGMVHLDRSAVAGANIRKCGQDVAFSDVIIPAGTKIKPAELGLLASQGYTNVLVYRPMKVGVLSTGDELVEPGTNLGLGKIYNSNSSMLGGLIRDLGMEFVDLGCIKDKPNETKDALLKACDEVDVILTAGGVSVGEEDHVRSAVDELGEIEFWKVAIKPGKPIAFGHVQGVPFVGLPGNPASVFVTFIILARPFLLGCQGAKNPKTPLVQAKALFNRAGESREVYLRGRLIAAGKTLGIEIHPNQSSGVLSSVSWGDVLVKQKIHQDISFNDLLDVIVY
jgi:molybdopterin molybdotransferase